MELVLGGVVGFVIGAVLAPLVSPWTELMEWIARRVWSTSPLIVHVERDQSHIWSGSPPWIGFVYFFKGSKPPAELPPGDCIEWGRWAGRHGGVDVSPTMLQVTIQAKTSVAVVIENVRVTNVRRPVPPGVAVWCPVGGAEITPRRFAVNLDGFGKPTVSFVNDAGEYIDPPALSLAAGEVERFQIWAEAAGGWNEWTLELPILVEGRRITVPVRNRRKPFVTVGDPNAPEFYLRDGKWVESFRLSEEADECDG